MSARVLKSSIPLLVMTGILVLLSTACAGTDAEAGVPGGDRTISLTALEYKGSTEVSKEAFPAEKLPDGGGYGLKDPAGDPLKWEVNAYAWAPASLTVVEGDSVTINALGVNGAEHVSSIEGHVERFTVERGKITTVQFTAGSPGIYQIVCQTHAPNMTGQLTVLPKN